MRTNLKLKLLYNYMCQKVSFASLVTLQKCYAGEIASKDVWGSAMKNVFTGNMIYFHRYKGLEMQPTVTPQDTLVIRKLPFLNARLKKNDQVINVGDVVVLKDPMDSNKHVVRRLAAVEGYEMGSTNEDDEPFVIEHGQGWVLSENKNLTPKESQDSRTYGPISMADIVGRVIYRFRTLEDNGFMLNNRHSMEYDMPVLYVELDSGEMHRFAEKEKQTKDY